MQRILLKSKIHRATVTDAQLHYEGSVTIDHDLMIAANIVEYEQVHIYDVNNGNRLITYAIRGPAASGTICVNGAWRTSCLSGRSHHYLRVCPVHRRRNCSPQAVAWSLSMLKIGEIQ